MTGNLLSVIIPILNEEKNIDTLYARVKSSINNLPLSHEIIFVNDGSTDNSLVLIKKLITQDDTVKFINLSRNFGHQQAVSSTRLL
jgi:polyisoprenyl-phosphate glycosyltransferase